MAEVQARSGVTFRPSAVASASVVQSSGSDVTFLSVSTTQAVQAHPAASSVQFNSDLPGISTGGFTGSLAYFDEPAAPVSWTIAPFNRSDPLCYNLPNDLKTLFDDLDERVAEGGGGGGGFTGSDADFILHNATDVTKKIRFDLSTISAGQTRVFKLPNLNGTLVTTANIAQTFTGPVTFSNTVSGITKTTVGLSHVDDTADLDKPISADTQAALNLKADASLIGTANGIAPLDSDAKVPASFLPSYVDDVIEVDTYTDLPPIGERSKIYIVIDTELQYRWSGSMYIQLVASPGTTDDVPEGTTNLYFTDARAVAALSSALALKANVNSPALTGVPTAPTATAGTNTTQLATTAFVTGAIAAYVAPVTSVNGHTGAVTVTAGDVGLGNVDDTSDADKPVSTAQQTALDAKVDKVFTPYQIYATNASSVQTSLTYDTAASTDTIVQRTAQGQVLATTLDDGNINASDDDLINRAYVANFRGDRMAHATLANGGSRTFAADEDVLVLLGSDVASYTVVLPSAETRYREVLIVFTAAVTALTIDPGLQADNTTPNAIDWVPTSAQANDAISFGYDFDHQNWLVLNAWMGPATGPATTDDLPEGSTNLYFTDTRAQDALTSALALKADRDSPDLTGVPTAPTAAPGTSTTQLATTAFVDDALAAKADVDSPTFIGIPAGPTAAPGTNTTQFATTAFVTAAVAAYTAPVTSVNGYTGAVTLAKGDIGLGSVDDTSDVDKPVSTAQQAALDLKADLALVGSANGIAPLGADSKVPSAYLPSFVDDVIEVADYASLPVTGESGKIYITLDTNYEYRWGGSVYVQLRASPGTTDDVPEGTTNLYFTDARAQAALASALALKANLNSPALTGVPTAPTASAGTNTTQLATTAFVGTALGGYLPLTGGTLTGSLVVGTSSTSNPVLSISGVAGSQPSFRFIEDGVRVWQMGPNGSSAFVFNSYNISTGSLIGSVFSVASGSNVLAFTASPTAPTPSGGDNSTKVATTAFVGTALGGYLPLTGGTLSGTLQVGDGSIAALLAINGAAGFARDLSFRSAGSNRWLHRINTTAESGANAGSDYQFYAFDDSGASLGTVYTVTRATRVLAFSVSPTAPTPTAGDSSTQVATTAFVGTALGSYLPLTGGTVTGAMTVAATFSVGNGTTNALQVINGAAGAVRDFVYRSAGASRWLHRVNNTAESGSDVGSDYQFYRYNDAGSASVVYTVTRATGVVAFGQTPTAPTASAGTNNTTLATTAFVGTALGGYLPLTGGTMTGALVLSSNNTYITGAAGSNRVLWWQSSGVNRWALYATSDAESGGDAGTNLVLQARDDSGASLGAVFTVARATRVMAFGVSPTAPTPTTSDNSTKVATTAFVQTNLGSYLPLTGGTLTGSLYAPNIAAYSTSTSVSLMADGPDGSNRFVRWRSNGLDRFYMYANSTAEGGSNAGSDLILRAMADDGSTTILNVFQVTRSTGLMTFGTIPAVGTATAGNNTTLAASTAFVTTAISGKANLASPALTGTPTAPTATAGTNNTQIATTAFVQAAVSGSFAATNYVATTSTSITMAVGNHYICKTSGSLTLTFPATSAGNDGKIVSFYASATLGGFAITVSGATVNQTPTITDMNTHTVFRYVYVAADTTWYRC